MTQMMESPMFLSPEKRVPAASSGCAIEKVASWSESTPMNQAFSSLAASAAPFPAPPATPQTMSHLFWPIMTLASSLAAPVS